MPSIKTYLQYAEATNTVGRFLKENSDFVMEETWDNDINSQVAYIYDYFHDDQPELNHGMTYENTTKTPVDIKFIVKEKGSLSKDQPSAMIQFKPSFKVSDFIEEDDFFYYEKDFHKRYNADFPVGLYCDIQDEKGVYHKWMICLADIQGNQFPKYFVLPCTYKLCWIERSNGKRIKRKMWSVLRSQSSYNSGIWLDTYITTTENQQLVWLPMNSITEKINYISDDNNTNQRFIVDIVCEHPDVWQLSKITRRSPFGTCKLGLYKHEWNPHTDYIDFDNMEMYADYNSTSVEPVTEESPREDIYCSLSTTTNTLKIGGSYKQVSASFFYEDGSVYENEEAIPIWSCFIDDVDMTDSDKVSWSEQKDKSKVRIKFADDNSYIGKIITIKCNIEDSITGEVQLELIAM